MGIRNLLKKNDSIKVLIILELLIFHYIYNRSVQLVITNDLRFILYVLSPFSLIILFNYLIELQIKQNYKNDDTRVNLCNKKSQTGLGDLLEHVIEIGIFSRTENFKNDPRGNSMLVKSAYTVSLIVMLVVFVSFCVFVAIETNVVKPSSLSETITFKDILTGYLAALAAINGLYWLEKNKYKEKWTYLSECYNKIIESRDYTRPIKHMDINTSIMLNALAIDILVTMMWGHRYFKELFLGESIKAVDHFIGNKNDSVKLLKNSHFSEDELVFILENYQLELMSYKTLKNVDVKLKGQWLDDAKKMKLSL